MVDDSGVADHPADKLLWFMFIAPLLSGPYLLADKFELKGVANQVRSFHLETPSIDAMTYVQEGFASEGEERWAFGGAPELVSQWEVGGPQH